MPSPNSAAEMYILHQSEPNAFILILGICYCNSCFSSIIYLQFSQDLVFRKKLCNYSAYCLCDYPLINLSDPYSSHSLQCCG